MVQIKHKLNRRVSKVKQTMKRGLTDRAAMDCFQQKQQPKLGEEVWDEMPTMKEKSCLKTTEVHEHRHEQGVDHHEEEDEADDDENEQLLATKTLLQAKKARDPRAATRA